MLITWDQKYSVGIFVIDEQHKQFVSLMAKLEKAIVEAKPGAVLDSIFDELDKYVMYHFSTEEKYFIEFKYRGAKEHIEAHKKFVERLTEVRKRYGKDELRLSLELVSFMSAWLINHINDMDRKYIETFHKNGLH